VILVPWRKHQEFGEWNVLRIRRELGENTFRASQIINFKLFLPLAKGKTIGPLGRLLPLLRVCPEFMFL